MTRLLKHWHALPIGNRIGGTISLLALVALLTALGGHIAALGRAEPEPPPAAARSVFTLFAP
jgi:hypothetical protein